MHTYTCMRTYTCMHTYIDSGLMERTENTYVHMHADIPTHTYIHTYLHTDIKCDESCVKCFRFFVFLPGQFPSREERLARSESMRSMRSRGHRQKLPTNSNSFLVLLLRGWCSLDLFFIIFFIVLLIVFLIVFIFFIVFRFFLGCACFGLVRPLLRLC